MTNAEQSWETQEIIRFLINDPVNENNPVETNVYDPYDSTHDLALVLQDEIEEQPEVYTGIHDSFRRYKGDWSLVNWEDVLEAVQSLDEEEREDWLDARLEDEQGDMWSDGWSAFGDVIPFSTLCQQRNWSESVAQEVRTMIEAANEVEYNSYARWKGFTKKTDFGEYLKKRQLTRDLHTLVEKDYQTFKLCDLNA